MVADYPHHFHHPEIVARWSPDRQIHAATLAEKPVEILKGSNGIVEKHAAKTGEEPVIGRVR